MIRALLISLSIFLYIPVFGQLNTDLLQEQISNKLSLLTVNDQQEKIHLHIDRSYYVPGEYIWLKAYLANASTHQFPTGSRYVYIELTDNFGTIIKRTMLRPQNGMHYGQILLSELLPEGYYTIHAYTKAMDNPDKDYFFRKLIRIGNLPNPENTEKQSIGVVEQSKEYAVSFLPEGGNLLEGVVCNIAFKAQNANGNSEHITGRIVDQNDSLITTFNTFHDGMGVFMLNPEKGKKYFANCLNESGISKRIPLPEAIDKTYSLSVIRQKDRFTFIRQAAHNSLQTSSYLLLHCRGNLLFFDEMNTNQYFWSFEEAQLPSGIIHAILFDSEMNPLSERLIFNFNNDQAHIEANADKTDYRIRDLVEMDLSVTDPKGNPVMGHLSIAITDNNDFLPDSSVNILSTFLLSSELRGYIESPAYYLQPESLEAVKALDILMMTHGWRRYDIPKAVKAEQTELTIPFETSKTISGNIKTSSIIPRPVEYGKVTLFSLEHRFFLEEKADEKGKFHFYDMEYPEGISYLLQGFDQKGRDNIRITLDREAFPSTKPLSYYSKNTDKGTTENINTFIQKAEERSKYDDNMRMVHLKEIEVTAQRIRRDPIKSVYSLNADNVITPEKIEKSNANRVTELLYGSPGVSINGDGAVTLGNGYPIVMIDGNILMETEYTDEELYEEGGDVRTSPIALLWKNDSPLERIHVSEVERIEVFRGVGAAILGVRGARGAINIITKKGGTTKEESKLRSNQATINPLGYTEPVEFFSPVYDTEEKRVNIKPDLRTTIFWKPNIVTDEEGKARIKFYTSDISTSYSVVIEGQTIDGRIIRATQSIDVK